MAGTEVIGTRVGDGYKQRFMDLCAKIGATPREVMENLIDDYFACKFSFSGGHIENGLLTRVEDDFEEENLCDGWEYHEFGFDTFVRLLRKKEYPDDQIKKIVNNFISAAYDMPKYNPRKHRDDWGS